MNVGSRPGRTGSTGRIRTASSAPDGACYLQLRLPSLWTRDLWHDDEIRLTEGARELLQSRGGLLPCVNGEIDFTAPPLPYWATSLLWEAGAGVASARVLSVLSVVGILLVCFAATVRSGSIARGVMAAAIALTTVVLFWHVRKGGAGPFWASLLTCALLAGYQALACKARRSGAWWVACYASAALAVLAVGVSAALLAASVLAVYCLAARKQPVKSVVPHLLGIAVFAGVIALWVAAVYHTVPGRGITLRPLTGDLAGLGESLREGNLLKAILATAAALFPWIVIVPGAIAAAFPCSAPYGWAPLPCPPSWADARERRIMPLRWWPR